MLLPTVGHLDYPLSAVRDAKCIALAGFLAADHLPEDGEGCEQADALVDFIAHDLARYTRP